MDKIFECNKCHKSFTQNYLLVRHNNGKKPCNIPKNIIKNIDNKILELDKLSFESSDTCYYCNKEYNRKDNLKRHVNYNCKKRNFLLNEKNKYLNEGNNNNDEDDDSNDNNSVNNNNDNNDNNDNVINNNTINDISKLKKEINKLKTCIKEISKSTTTINNIHNIDNSKVDNSTTDNSKNISIVVNIGDTNSYGKEDLSHIEDKDYKNYLSKFLPGLIKYIEDVHFSDKMPKNRNLCISKLDSKYISIYEKNNWNAKDKDEQLKKIITKNMSLLDKKCEELNKSGIIEEQIVDKFNEFFNTYYEGPEQTKQKFKDELEMMIFNNRKKINDYKNLLK
jgi:hypothetical protein